MPEPPVRRPAARLTPEQEQRFALVRQLDTTPGTTIVLVGEELMVVEQVEADMRGLSPLLTSDEVASMGLAHLDDGTLSVPGAATAALLVAERRRLAEGARRNVTSAA